MSQHRSNYCNTEADQRPDENVFREFTIRGSFEVAEPEYGFGSE